MKKAPKYKVLFSQCRFNRLQDESISTKSNDKLQAQQNNHPEHTTRLGYLCNLSAPISDEELTEFIDEASQILNDHLYVLEMKGGEEC